MRLTSCNLASYVAQPELPRQYKLSNLYSIVNIWDERPKGKGLKSRRN